MLLYVHRGHIRLIRDWRPGEGGGDGEEWGGGVVYP